MRFVALGFTFLFWSSFASSTTFKLQTVGEQLKEADAIMIGHYLKKKSIQLEDGSIATQMVFKINQEHGINSDLFGIDEVIVHYPGGKINGQTLKVEGVPQFISGERVVLLTKSLNNRYWGLNLGFGTFKIINFGKETLLINTLFPENTKVSQMKLEDFEKTVREIKGSSLKVVIAPIEENEPDEQQRPVRAPASISEGKNRTIASSFKEGENTPSELTISIYWLILTFAIAGGLFRFFRQTKTK